MAKSPIRREEEGEGSEEERVSIRSSKRKERRETTDDVI